MFVDLRGSIDGSAKRKPNNFAFLLNLCLGVLQVSKPFAKLIRSEDILGFHLEKHL